MLQLHNAIHQLRFYLNLLIQILLLANSHNNIASLQKNRDDKLHRIIVALDSHCCLEKVSGIINLFS